jgi:hypothetical protein
MNLEHARNQQRTLGRGHLSNMQRIDDVEIELLDDELVTRSWPKRQARPSRRAAIDACGVRKLGFMRRGCIRG